MLDDRDQSKLRLCLRCRTYFQSSDAGNRLCPKCKKSSTNIDPSYNPVQFSLYYHSSELTIINQAIEARDPNQDLLEEVLSEDL